MSKASKASSRTFFSISACWMMALLLGSPRVRAAAFVVKRCQPSSTRLASTAADESTDMKGDWKSFKPEDLAGPDRYRLCVSSVVPRPVAVITSISSKDSEGIVNCAPFSYTSMAANDPPIVTHGINLSGGKKKDTLANIEATGEWVFNVLTTKYLENANSCAASLAPDVSETEEFGLKMLPCELVIPPRLAEASVAMECKLVDKKEIFNDAGEHTTTIVMGRVVNFHVHESVLQEGQPDTAPIVDLEKLNAVGRAGGVTYWPVGVESANTSTMGRPK
jgi:flavin reductase (DIM6/NTAB) family NADH-FMN oxidoreductase RutF